MATLVGKQFPDLSVDAMNEMGDTFKINVLEEAKKNNKKVLLFWYPKDFTFVCPTEIHAFQAKLKDFNDRGYQVLGASCDTAEVHFAWLSTPKQDGGIEGVEFPLLSDTTRRLSTELNILDDESVTYRATYLIDGNGRIFHQSVNDMPLGRNIDELLRLIDAKAHNDKHGEVCPANWSEGKEAMAESRQGVKDYLSK